LPKIQEIRIRDLGDALGQLRKMKDHERRALERKMNVINKRRRGLEKRERRVEKGQPWQIHLGTVTVIW
jgi:hypothetical protein